MKSTATNSDEYLGSLSAERRSELEQVLKVVRKNMPKGYVEGFGFGMIAFIIPLSRFPDTYNKQPLGYVMLAAQKNYFSLHLLACYQSAEKESELKKAFADAGKKLDMGKACVRFRKAEDLPLPAIGKLIASVSPDQFIQRYEAARAAYSRSRQAGGRA